MTAEQRDIAVADAEREALIRALASQYTAWELARLLDEARADKSRVSAAWEATEQARVNLGKMLEEREAEIARLTAPPEASAMERAAFALLGWTRLLPRTEPWLDDYETIDAGARLIEQAERAAFDRASRADQAASNEIQRAARAVAFAEAARACEGPGNQWDARQRIHALAQRALAPQGG